MESSSEDSFLWSDASIDTSDREEMAKATNINQSDVDSEYGQSYKKKLHKELFVNGEHETESRDQPTEKSRKRKIKTEKTEEADSPKKKKIKVEPESDIELKNNSKHRLSVNQQPLPDDDSTYDESYLNLRVKQEQTFTIPSAQKKRKKNHKSESVVNSENEIESNTENNNVIAESNFETSTLSHQADSEDYEGKAKKKKKKSRNKSESTEQETIIEEKFTAEETVVETRQPISSSDCDAKKSSKENLDKRKKKKHLHSHSDSEDNEEGSKNRTVSCPEAVRDHDMPEIVNTKTSRTISERIRFEEEESDIDVRTLDNQSRKLRNYLKANVNLKPAVDHLKEEALVTSDDEIFLIKCPSIIDLAAFKGVKINLDKKCKIKINNQTYECNWDEGKNKIAVLSRNKNKTVIKGLPVNGMLCLRKRIPKLHIREENYMINNQNNFIPLLDTKCRHPLFGANYKKAIKIPFSVAERLREVDQPQDIDIVDIELEKTKKKKKKKDKDKIKIETSYVEKDNEQTDAEELPPKKKSKKHKHTKETEKVKSKKTKQKRHNLDTAEAWESEKAIEESLFNF